MMIGAINAVKPYQSVSRIDLQRTAKLYADARQNAKAGQTQQSVANAASAQNVQSAKSAPAIGAPVAQSAERMSPAQKLEQGADPVEMAVRMRIQQPGAEETAAAGTAGQGREAQFGMVGQQEEAPAMKLPGQKDEPTTPIEKELAEQAEKAEEAKEARKAEQAEELKESEEAEESKDVQDIMEEEECQTCENRKYQDGSDDPGVSFKAPTRIAPEAAASAVRGHEMEHVVRERAAAKREGKEVVSQSVTLHSGICPECGDVYISGGTTTTTTAKKAEPPQQDTAEWVKRANHFSIVV